MAGFSFWHTQHVSSCNLLVRSKNQPADLASADQSKGADSTAQPPPYAVSLQSSCM